MSLSIIDQINLISSAGTKGVENKLTIRSVVCIIGGANELNGRLSTSATLTNVAAVSVCVLTEDRTTKEGSRTSGSSFFATDLLGLDLRGFPFRFRV
jgi:hypothetical protein